MASNGDLAFRVVGGPIPKDVRVSVRCSRSDIVASALSLSDDALRRELHLRGSGSRLWDDGPVIHASAFDVLQLELIGGGQGKVVAMLDADSPLASFVPVGHRAETVLLLRARSFLPPGLPGAQSKVFKLAAPLVVKKKPDPKPPTPPKPKPDLALRFVGGPIPRDVRIVLKVFRTTQFMDMFPLIHEKVELVAPLAVVSARYYNLYEFEIVRHGKGKKRRALFAKDTPSSIELTSNVLFLEEKPVWKHIAKPAENRGDDESSDAESDNLSDIRPPSATSTLRERDTDTPPGTVGLAVDGDEATEEPGWWEARSHNVGPPLTEDALKVKNANLGSDNVAVSKQILDLVMPHNQQAQLVRVVGKCIPRTARVIIDILRTQTFISLFPMIQAKVVEFVPTAHITPYRYEMLELELLPHGATRIVRPLKLDQTPWTTDFGLASIVMLRELPQGFLEGTSDATALDYELPPDGGSTNPSKPGTATSLKSSSTVVASRVAQRSANAHPSRPVDLSRSGDTVTPRLPVLPRDISSTVPSAVPSIAGDIDEEEQREPSLFQGAIDVDEMELLEEEEAPVDSTQPTAAPSHSPPADDPDSEMHPTVIDDTEVAHVERVVQDDAPAAATDDLELIEEDQADESRQREEGGRGSAARPNTQFSSPHRPFTEVVDIAEDGEDVAVVMEHSPSRNIPVRAPSVPMLRPLSHSSKYDIYQDHTPRDPGEPSSVEVHSLGGSQNLRTPREPPPEPAEEPHPHSTLQDSYHLPDGPISMQTRSLGASGKIASASIAFNALRSLKAAVSLSGSALESRVWESDDDGEE